MSAVTPPAIPARRPVREALRRWLLARAMALEAIGDIGDVTLTDDSSFDPSTVSGLHAWYDATELTGFTDGDPVGTWPDEENTFDLTQSSSSLQPTYKTGIINSNPILRFDGSDDYLDVDFTQLSEPWQVFCVGTLRISDTSARTMWADQDGGDPALFQNGNGNWTLKVGGSSDIENGSTDTNPHVHTVLHNGADTAMRRDGTETATGSASEPLNGFRLARRGIDDLKGPIDMGEVLIYDADLSTSDRDSVESYLGDKWGITV